MTTNLNNFIDLNVKLIYNIFTQHVMKMNAEAEVSIHVFLTLVLDGCE
jgi:hypothetical protein